MHDTAPCWARRRFFLISDVGVQAPRDGVEPPLSPGFAPDVWVDAVDRLSVALLETPLPVPIPPLPAADSRPVSVPSVAEVDPVLA